MERERRRGGRGRKELKNQKDKIKSLLKCETERERKI
jgi:hypothetical protein